MEENQRNDAFEAMNEMLSQKKKDNQLKKISEIDDIDKEIENKVPLSKEDIETISKYEANEVGESIYASDRDYKAKEVDINNIRIVEKRALETNQLLMNALKPQKSSSSFEIVASQSGYSCKVSPLNNRDSFNILNSSSSEYENNRSTYKVIYDKIIEFSCGKMTFEQWLANTSVADLETFYYGLYCATFLDQGSFKFTCPDAKCGHQTEQIIRNDSLKQVADFDEMTKLSKKITEESNSIAKMKELSLLNNAAPIELKNSGFIMELKIPSLLDFLDLYRTVPSQDIRTRSDADINSLLCISGMLIPDGNGAYVPDIDKRDILQVIDNLSLYDAASLRKTIIEILNKYHVTYKIKSVKCAKCGKEIKDVPIDLRSILFTEIFASRS